MSNYDQNTAAPGTSADQADAIDAGLRAYMLRVITTWPSALG